MLCANTFFTLRGRDEQHGHLARLKDRKIEINLTVGSHNHIEGWGWLAQAEAQLPVGICERGVNIFCSPAMLRN